jgi:phosphoketolase
MYRFDPTISSVIEEAGTPSRQALSAEGPAVGSLSAEQLAGIQRYWQAANYLTGGRFTFEPIPSYTSRLGPST